MKPGGDSGPAAGPEAIPDLICFWDFQEPAGQDRVARGPHRYALREMLGPIRRAEGGVFGEHCAELEHPQWFRIAREDCPALDLHGETEVTVVAWIQRESDRSWQYIAGVWNERDAKRQYALFTCGHKQTDSRTYERTRAEDQAHGYVSDVGGAPPGRPFCFSYATGKTKLKKGRWYMLAFTYDRKEIRVYVDGKLDAQGHRNPFAFDKPVFDGGRDGADFTVAHRALPTWPGYPNRPFPMEEGFDGKIGGLAVYSRALTANEIEKLCAATMGQARGKSAVGGRGSCRAECARNGGSAGASPSQDTIARQSLVFATGLVDILVEGSRT